MKIDKKEATTIRDMDEAIKRAFRDKYDIDVEVDQEKDWGTIFFRVESKDGPSDTGEREWIVFLSDDDAEWYATQRVKEDLEDDPFNLFTPSWLNEFLYVTDTDRRLIAGDEASNRTIDMTDDEILEEADKLDDWEELEDKIDEIKDFYDSDDNYKDFLNKVGMKIPEEFQSQYSEYGEYLLKEDPTAFDVGKSDWRSRGDDEKDELIKEQEEMVDEAREKLEEKIYDEWYKGLEDPVEFLVREQGIYSIDDLNDVEFIRIDTDEAAKDAIRQDGVAHFIDFYDGEEEEISDPETKQDFLIYGTN